MRIDSSGNVVLGSSANGGQAMTTLQGYSPNSANGSYGNLLFSANANYTGGASRFLLTNAFNVTDFAIISSVDATTTPTLDSGGAVSSGTVVFSLKAGGNAAFLGNIGIGGTTPTTSGTGITFPATQNASSDANTLDDYEEGTWTPIIQGSTTVGTGTYTTQQGTYTKIGNTVRFQAEVVWTAHTGTGQLEVGDYPFTSTAETSPISLGFNGGPTFTLGNFIQAYKNPSNTSSGTAQTSDASVFTSVSVSNTGTVRVSGVYKVA
jgi:hypothetical protein